MAKRALSKAARFERLYKIWEYLKKNTDSEHPTSQAKMRQAEEIAEYIGDKETFNRLIKDMARAMNTDENGYDKPEAEWKIFFNDYKKYFGDDADLELNGDDYEDYVETSMRISGLYYNHTFSYEEVNSLIEGVLATKTLDTKSANKLIKKIEDNLTTKFYKKGPKQICKVQEPELVDREVLRENLLTIQKAIDHNVQISFYFNGYTYQKKLELVRPEKYVVSPYYIVASSGRYYLLACMEVQRKEKIIKNMSIWRVDLMTKIEIPGANEILGIPGIKRIPKREVENLPETWNENFQLEHLNMSYDKPEWITLRIVSEKKEDDPTKRVRPDYTFLHDWFGNNFRFVKTESEPPYNDIVKVKCSPYGMVNWALQYSDRVEIVEPEAIRNTIIEKVKNLNVKYDVD